MPWRGPEYDGEFPTLGYIIGEQIEKMCIIPDGPALGEPFKLTGEMWNHLIYRHRIRPRAMTPDRIPLHSRRYNEGMLYKGSQLRRGQKWGKNPFRAAQLCIYALGDCVWDGWDAYGEPVARPVATPWIAICATSEPQTMNTYAPLVRMLTHERGGFAYIPGLDVGDMKTKLPNGEGWIERATASADTILGRPISYASITEPHLMVTPGDIKFAQNVMRNIEALGGWWDQDTNAWDPSQMSVGRLTGEFKEKDVYLDHRRTDLPNLTSEEFDSDRKVLERIVIKYGDSCRRNGGWVNERDILGSIRKRVTGEANARRYYLDEVTAGETVAVDPLRWEALSLPPGEVLGGREPIALGFDGSRSRDATALIACRLSDGAWFPLGIWVPADYRTDEQIEKGETGKVPVAEVEQAMEDAYAAYDVWFMIADPYLWQTTIDKFAGRWGRNAKKREIVMDFPTNVESRMDEAIDIWESAFETGKGEFAHSGDPVLTRHAYNAKFANGKRKAEREGPEGETRAFYRKIVKAKKTELIDAYVAGVLATFGRQLAVENGALEVGSGFNIW